MSPKNIERLGMVGVLASGLLWMDAERKRVLDELEGVRADLRALRAENGEIRQAFQNYASDMAREMARVAFSGD